MILPGGQNLRVSLHRVRGVSIGRDVWISSNVVLETEFPNLVTIDDNAFVGIGVIVIAHFKLIASRRKDWETSLHWAGRDHSPERGDW